MRPHVYTLAVLACTAALAGCASDTVVAENSESEFITVEPVDVTPQIKITRYADENRDGVVTRKEAKADPRLAASFDHYDLDQNDKLDRGEFARLEAEQREARAAAAQAQTSRTWATEMRPDGYFGPGRTGQTLNRTGGDQSRPEDSE
jgi:hypothetical protein